MDQLYLILKNTFQVQKYGIKLNYINENLYITNIFVYYKYYHKKCMI